MPCYIFCALLFNQMYRLSEHVLICNRTQKNISSPPDLIKIFCCCPHFFPGLVQQLDTDGKQFLKCTVMGEKHGVIVIPAFIGFRKKQSTTM